MKTYLTYGLFLTLSLFAFNLILFVSGFHSDAGKMETVSTLTIVISTLLSAVFIVLGSRARRNETPADKPFGYGQALLSGLMISVFAGLIGMVTSYLYMHVINPGFNDVMSQVQVAKMEAKGMTSDQIEQAQSMMKKFMNPVMQAIFGFIAAVFFGFLISLITSIFTRRKDETVRA